MILLRPLSKTENEIPLSRNDLNEFRRGNFNDHFRFLHSDPDHSDPEAADPEAAGVQPH